MRIVPGSYLKLGACPATMGQVKPREGGGAATRMFQGNRNTAFIQILQLAGLGDVGINLERQRSKVVGCRLECGLMVPTVTVNIVGAGGLEWILPLDPSRPSVRPEPLGGRQGSVLTNLVPNDAQEKDTETRTVPLRKNYFSGRSSQPQTDQPMWAQNLGRVRRQKQFFDS
jgi:hypothetical protein